MPTTRPHSHAQARSLRACLATVVVMSCCACSVAQAEDAPPDLSVLQDGLPPADYLHFTEAFNARCESLSSGGKMVSLRNRHPHLALRYRMVRFFADAPQGGMVAGTLLPGAEAVELGCNRVDRRKQHWEVNRLTLEPVPAVSANQSSAAESPSK